MTREELNSLKAEMETYRPYSYQVNRVIAALEQAWRRIDEVEKQNLDLTVERNNADIDRSVVMTERDRLQSSLEAAEASLAAWESCGLTEGGSGMSAEASLLKVRIALGLRRDSTDDLLEVIARIIEERDQLKQRVQELGRGEYTCKRCGIRKDGESTAVDF